MKKNVLHKYSIHPCRPPHTSFCRDAIVSVDIISVIRLSNESRHVAKEQFFINFCPKKQTRALDEKKNNHHLRPATNNDPDPNEISEVFTYSKRKRMFYFVTAKQHAVRCMTAARYIRI